MTQAEIRNNVDRYVRQRDVHFDLYVQYARRFGIPVKSLFVLNALYYAPGGCTQVEISLRAYSSKQTVGAIIKKYLKCGYVELKEVPTDRRGKLTCLTEAGWRYAEAIIPPLTRAETAAMARLSLRQQETLVELTTLFGNHLQEQLKEE